MLTPDQSPYRGYTMRELSACAEREVKLRRRVYANRVLTHRMSQAQADAEINKMAAIAEMLWVMAERERLL
jgi:hypothetical protein